MWKLNSLGITLRLTHYERAFFHGDCANPAIDLSFQISSPQVKLQVFDFNADTEETCK